MKTMKKDLIEHLFTLEIPRYITKVKTAEKKRAKYYSTVAGSGRVKKLPVRLAKKGNVRVDSKGFYLDENGNKIVANTRTVGKEAFTQINGQILYVGSPWQRVAIKNGLEEFYIPYIENLPFMEGSILMEMEMHCPYHSTLGDMDNLGYMYGKVFSDTLVNCGKIEDDKAKYITKPPTAPLFCPVKTDDERKLVFHFFRDLRPEIINLHEQ